VILQNDKNLLFVLGADLELAPKLVAYITVAYIAD